MESQLGQFDLTPTKQAEPGVWQQVSAELNGPPSAEDKRKQINEWTQSAERDFDKLSHGNEVIVKKDLGTELSNRNLSPEERQRDLFLYDNLSDIGQFGVINANGPASFIDKANLHFLGQATNDQTISQNESHDLYNPKHLMALSLMSLMEGGCAGMVTTVLAESLWPVAAATVGVAALAMAANYMIDKLTTKPTLEHDRTRVDSLVLPKVNIGGQ